MPPYALGSLSDLEHLQILAYLLIESNFVKPEDKFNMDDLANVILSE